METYTALTHVMVVFSKGSRGTLSGYESLGHVRSSGGRDSVIKDSFPFKGTAAGSSHFASISLHEDSSKSSEIPSTCYIPELISRARQCEQDRDVF
jgi:hypothetical protein